jgi:hypothetical protein
MPNKWHICKEGKAGNEKRQLLVFSEPPSLPSAGSRPLRKIREDNVIGIIGRPFVRSPGFVGKWMRVFSIFFARHFIIFFARPFPVRKRRTPLLYIFRLCGSPVSWVR